MSSWSLSKLNTTVSPAAAQGIDFRRPLETAPLLGQVLSEVRARVPFRQEDRLFAPDMAAIEALIGDGRLRRAICAEAEAAPGLLSLTVPD